MKTADITGTGPHTTAEFDGRGIMISQTTPTTSGYACVYLDDTSLEKLAKSIGEMMEEKLKAWAAHDPQIGEG